LRIHIDIGHPAHVHLFKNFARIMLKKGNEVFFTVRNKENAVALMIKEGFTFTETGRHYASPAGKLWGLIKNNIMLLCISIREKPGIFLSHGSLYTLLSSFLLRIPNITLEDTGNQEQVRLYWYFTKAILTSDSFVKRYGRKQIRYNGCHELAYLHPAYFTPDNGVMVELGLEPGERYFIVRFVSWQASHDMAFSGLSLPEKREIVSTLQKYGKVFISSESSLPEDLAPMVFPLLPERMHHALAFASLYAGEGATMASEAGILGTPAVYINPMEAGSVDEQESYGLIFHFRTFDGVKEKITELLSDVSVKENTVARSLKFISSKADLTAFLVWFIGDWPESFRRIRTS
jgi:uncharacterized protein